MLKHKWMLAGVALLLLAGAGCKKKTPVLDTPPPPPVVKPAPPPPAAPVITSFTAEPATIARGESATLRWAVNNATDVTLEGFGAVTANGNRRVEPGATTTYRLSAKGPGGSASATATVNVSVPPPPPERPKPTRPTRSLSERMTSEVLDIFFDYDQSEIREDARALLSRNADALKSILSDYPTTTIVLEGHCDERGSAEYNLGLGDRRSTAALEFLKQVGVPADRIKPVSYGKDKPQCSEQTEDCWQKNRRVHFVAQ